MKCHQGVQTIEGPLTVAVSSLSLSLPTELAMLSMANLTRSVTKLFCMPSHGGEGAQYIAGVVPVHETCA
jgi:hypothetical protein